MATVEKTTTSTNKKIVFIKVVFLKLGNIDTVKENFSADIFIQARWREESLDHGKLRDNVNFSQYWEPKLIVQNVVSTSKDKQWKELKYGKSEEAFIVLKHRIKGVFTENLELQEFPFDLQDLSVVLTSERSEDELELREDDQELCSINISCFVNEQEWILRDFVESEMKTMTKEFSEAKNIAYPFLSIRALAMRRAGFYVWNIIIIMTIISSLSFATFAVDRNLPQNRLQLAFTLTLTGVTFRFVTNQQLPKISYLTRLDWYILFCMIFNYLVSCWHAVVTRLTDNDEQATGDLGAFIAFIALYALFHIVYFLLVLVVRFVKERKASEKEQEYQTKAVKILGETWKSKRTKRLPKRKRIGPLPF